MKHSGMIATAAIAAALLALPAVAADKAGDVVQLRGAAKIQRDAKSLDARVRSELMIQDAVQTRDRTRMKMLFADDSVLVLGSNTRLVVQQHLSADGKRKESIYELADGKLKAVVGRPGFAVKTPTAFAAARGSVTFIWHDGKMEETTVMTLEGLMEVRNIRDDIAGSQIVGPGQFTVVRRGRPPDPPQMIPPGGGAATAEIRDTEPPKPSEPVAGGEVPTGVESLSTEFSGLTTSVPPISQEPLAQPATKVNVNIVFP